MKENIVNELLTGLVVLRRIADHAEHEHDAVCVANDLGQWAATLITLLYDFGILTLDDVDSIIEWFELEDAFATS